VKLKETAIETFMLPCEPYGEDALARACAYAWYKSFSEGTRDPEDDQKSGCLTVTKMMKI
jgi:hypothetical protein